MKKEAWREKRQTISMRTSWMRPAPITIGLSSGVPWERKSSLGARQAYRGGDRILANCYQKTRRATEGKPVVGIYIGYGKSAATIGAYLSARARFAKRNRGGGGEKEEKEIEPADDRRSMICLDERTSTR